LTVIEKAPRAGGGADLAAGAAAGRLDARLPRYQLGALQMLAEDAQESVEAVLMRKVEELVDLFRAPRPRHPRAR
jgi:hypothetical protein